MLRLASEAWGSPWVCCSVGEETVRKGSGVERRPPQKKALLCSDDLLVLTVWLPGSQTSNGPV